MAILPLLSFAAEAAKLIFQLTGKDKSVAALNAVRPLMESSLDALGQAAEETDAQRTERLARMESAFRTYADAPPPGAKAGG